MKANKISAKIVAKTDFELLGRCGGVGRVEMKKKDMYLHDNAPKIGHMVAETPKIKNGLFKPRLYGNIGQASNRFPFGGLYLTPKMDLL